MHSISRRHLMAGVTVIGAPFIVAGSCQLTTQQVTEAVVSDIGLIASGLSAILPQLSTLGALATTVVNDAKTAAAQIKAGLAANVALPFVQKVQADLQLILTTAAQINVPDLVTKIVQAGITLVNTVLPLLGVTVAAAPAPGAMTPDQARLVLKSVS